MIVEGSAVAFSIVQENKTVFGTAFKDDIFEKAEDIYPFVYLGDKNDWVIVMKGSIVQ